MINLTLRPLAASILLCAAAPYSFSAALNNDAQVIDVAKNIAAPVIRDKKLGSVTENTPWQKQLSAKDKDATSQALYFRLISAPAGFTLSTSGLAEWTPNFNNSGEHNITISVTDGKNTSQKTLLLKVKDVNRAPVWQQSTLDSAKENMAYSAKLLASDGDNQALQFTLKSAPKGMKIEQGHLLWQPSFEQAGEHTIKIAASDGIDKSVQIFNIHVENTNRTAAFTSAAITAATEDESYTYKLKAHDADDDDLNFELVSGPKGLTLKGQTLSMRPSFEQAGEYPVHVKVTDGSADKNLIDEQFFVLQVANTNRSAEIKKVESTQLAAIENSPWALKVNATDADNDSLKISLVTYPAGMTIQQGLISWTPTFENEGEHNIIVAAHDGTVETTYAFSVVVSNTNRAPSFTSEMVLNAKEAEQYQYVLRATDPDLTPLSFTLVSGPEGLILDPAKKNRLTWLPGYQQSGEHKVVVAVSDGETTIEQSNIITVENTNRAPEFPAPITTVLEDNLYSYKANAQDPDLEDKKSVTVTAVTLPEGITFKNNTLTWKPNFKAAGSYPIVLNASDGVLETEQSFSLVVENNNRAPVISSKPALVAHETLSYTYTIQASDA
ncbi:MAG: tandem-95 repeat protein, partial [Sinobacterium sp.]|nr:tandem-95 repeat protein [Sinobacterium sp.]